jgi:hypothetical protein
MHGLRIETRFAEMMQHGPGLDSIMGLLLNATGGGGWDALTAGSGDSFTIKSFPPGSRAYIISAHAGNSTTKCDFSIRSPRMHDSTRGYRMAYEFNPTLSGADGGPAVLWPWGVKQEVFTTDTLVFETLATANDDVNLIASLYYESLGGIDSRLITPAEVQARAKNLLGNRVSPTAGATNLYGTSEAINADDDRFIADTDYALLGILTDLPTTSIGIRGPDTGNLRAAIPASWNNQMVANYFVNLSNAYNLPLIPVINSNNKSVTFVDACDASSSTSPLICLLWAELQP